MDEDLSSDSDLEMAILDDAEPKPRRARQLNERAFGDAIDEVTRQQQHRVPIEVVNFLEDRLSPLLKHPQKETSLWNLDNRLNSSCISLVQMPSITFFEMLGGQAPTQSTG